MWVVWMVIGLVMIMIEVFTVTFYFLWFGIAAFATAFVAYFLPDKIWVQLFVAAILVLALSLTTPKFTKKFGKKSPGYQEGKFDVVGKKGVVVSPISPNDYGVVKIAGHGEWSAVSDEPDVIAEGTEVIVKEINGLIVTVAPFKPDAPDSSDK